MRTIYQRNAWVAGAILSLFAAAAPQQDNAHEMSTRRSLIMGGDSVAGPHPWVVSLQHRNFHFCGGTLLDEWHVLTAAHCERRVRCTGDFCEGVDVNIRRHNISSLAENEFLGCSTILRSARWVSHPQYSGSPRHLHDIAILRLRDPVPSSMACRAYGLSSHATSSVDLLQEPLRTSNVVPGSPVQAVGWGRMWPSGPSSSVLLDTPMRAILAIDCRRAWHSILGDEQICAAGGSNGETRDVCNGDSGGPLIVPDTNIQVGVVSYSHKCGTPGVPSVFTDPRTPGHYQWIRATVDCLSTTDCCPYPSASDGEVSEAEECDDGNIENGDGCFCGLLEPGYYCHGSPSLCVLCADVPPPPPPAGVHFCLDRSSQCRAWAARGECLLNPAYMSARCPQSCRVAGCWIDTRPSPREAFLHLETFGTQSLRDYSWEIKARFATNEDNPFVRNLGMGDGFLICAQPNMQYELHVNNDRWNTSAGFSISFGQNQPPTFQVESWTGSTTSVVFTMDGIDNSVDALVEIDSCVNVQLYDPDKPGAPPSIVPNSPAVFGTPDFDLDLTPHVWGLPAKGCGERLTNRNEVRGKIVVLDRGDCFFVHKANVAQEAGAVGLLVVNYDDDANRGLTIAMGAASDSSRQLDNVCCVDIPLAMVTSGTGRLLRDNPHLQISLSASNCYSAPTNCPVAWVGSVQPGCGSCAAGTILDCNEVCRPSQRLGNGQCDIGEEISGATHFACAEHDWDNGDCPRIVCTDDLSWRDPSGRGCSDAQYSAVPGVCGEYEESYVKCRRTCHTCAGACNALYDTVADQGIATSCAKISSVFGVSCDHVEAAGIDCTHARYCGYCSRERTACARGWQLDCDAVCAPVAWIGDGVCDDGRTTAFNFNCREGGWWDGGDCPAQHPLPAGCSNDGAPLLGILRASSQPQEVSIVDGYGDNWDCRWEITCRQDSTFYVAFESFDTESGFDSLSIFDGPAAELQFEPVNQQQCHSLHDTNDECTVWAARGECETNARYMLIACAFSCTGCAQPAAQPQSIWSGNTLPHPYTQSVAGGALTLRFSSDSNTQATGFAFSYACGQPTADVAPCASGPCQNGGTCTESVDAERYWCSCTFGFDGALCTDALPLELPAGNCELRVVDIADRVTSACCGPANCIDGVPSSCSAQCATIWTPFSRACSEFLHEAMPQMGPFTASCEVEEYGIVKRRCPLRYWQAGVSAVLSACCPRGDRDCANDITQLPATCPNTGSCGATVAELYTACHVRAEQRQPAAYRALLSLKRSCDQE